jgi:hypothetical protein
MKWLNFFKRKPKRYYRVGDLAPDSLLNHKAGDGNLGAMISVDPLTKRITAIFIP